MNNKNILKLACNIIGIYFLVQSISQVKGFALLSAPVFMGNDTLSAIDFYRETEYYSLFVTLSSIFFDLAIAVILLFRAEWIVNRLDRNASEDAVQVPMDRVVLIELTIIAIGIFIFATAVPNVLTNIVEYFALNKRDGEITNAFWTYNNRSGGLVFSVVEVIVGVVLASNGRSIARRLERVGDINATPAVEKNVQGQD